MRRLVTRGARSVLGVGQPSYPLCSSSRVVPEHAGGADLATFRRAVTTRLATLVPAPDRKAVVEKWAEVGDDYALQITHAGADLDTLKGRLEDAEALLARATAESERLREWVKDNTDITSVDDAVHPTLGHLVRDLGYKRVYLASVQQLANLEIWEKQRILRHERAQSIAAQKRKAGFPVKVPGVLTVYELGGVFKLLDGQHRLAALRILADTGIVNPSTNFVLVEVFPLKKESEVDALFREINAAQPIKLIDMPDEARPDFKKIINEATEALKARFPDMFSVSQQARLPHLNIDSLRNDLYRHGVIERHETKDADALLAFLLKCNDTLGNRSDREWKRVFKGRNTDTIEKALEKSRRFKLYLGLDRSWLSM